jgi:hypothetical protein
MNLAVVLNDTDGREHFARLKVPERCRNWSSVPALRVQKEARRRVSSSGSKM